MAGQPWPHDSPEAWNQLTLGDRPWPGVATVKIKGGQDIDKKRPYGKHGANLKFQGQKPKTGTITVRTWTAAQWEQLQVELEEIEPVGGKRDEQPRGVTHPVFAARKVASIAIEDIDGPEWDGQFMVVVLTWVQWFPPPQSTKGTGTAKAAQKTSPPQYKQLPSSWDEDAGIGYRVPAKNRPSKTAGTP